MSETERSKFEALVLAHDWSKTSIGPIETWPRALKAYVAMITEMPSPAIIFWGPEHVQIYNAGYAVIMGPRHPKYFGATYRACWPETYPLIHPWMVDVLEHGTVKQVERTLIPVTRRGFTEEAYFTFSFSPLRDDTGTIAGILQPVVEVTDSVLAERRAQTLRDLAPRLDVATGRAKDPKAALEANPYCIPFALVYLREEPEQPPVLVADSGFADGVSPAALARLGGVVDRVLATRQPIPIADCERLLGQPHFGAWPEPTRTALALPLTRDLAEPPLGAIVLGISPRLEFDARYRAFCEDLSHELAGHYAAARAKRVEHDLLVREQTARRELELQREHLVALFTQAPTPMVVLRGPEMRIELVNAPATQVWERAYEDVIGRPLFDALPELRGQIFEELLAKVYRTGEPQTGDAIAAQLDRGEVYFTFVYAPIRDLAGSVDGVLVLAFDVTEQVRAREQVDELRAAAETANRAKDQFLAILGHELRNPLSPILTAVELIRLRGSVDLTRNLDIIERQAKHMSRLVEDLLDISRIARGQIELRKRPVEIAQVIADALDTMTPILAQRGHDVTVEVPAAGLRVDVDPARMAQVMTNLLANAAKYTAQAGRIRISAERREAHVSVRVRDTGVGIPPPMIPRLFDMFVQAPQALDRSEGGLGLGLAIVRHLVELHGGTVEAHSDGPGRGSEFVVYLPLALATTKPGDARPRVEAPAAAPRASARRILIVDDNEDAADLLAQLLQVLGDETRIAHDGETALQIANELEPDLALLDLGLPTMDGYELARRLRERGSPVQLVALTGYGQDSDRQRTREAGFDAHLVKPVNLDDLLSELTRLGATGAPR